MNAKQSGQQIAKDNLLKFQTWIAEREAANDWYDYLRGDKLNRSEIAAECGFSLSVLRQNPAVKELLLALEARLEILSVTQPLEVSYEEDTAAKKVVDKRIMAAMGKAEARVKVLEEQNAAFKAEVADLRERLRRYDYLDDHLGRTGRLLPT